MKIMDTIRKYKKERRIRKQMNMTKNCSKELDGLLNVMGIELSDVEMCDMTKYEITEDELK